MSMKCNGNHPATNIGRTSGLQGHLHHLPAGISTWRMSYHGLRTDQLSCIEAARWSRKQPEQATIARFLEVPTTKTSIQIEEYKRILLTCCHQASKTWGKSASTRVRIQWHKRVECQFCKHDPPCNYIVGTQGINVERIKCIPYIKLSTFTL